MNKVIHYVWVGGKPLPKLAKKCIKSWKKYLPDWDIIQWNEKNFDIESSLPFVKQAYYNQKWAFVADYIRTKALYEFGGIYFDTDMELLGDISDFLEKPAFLGKEFEANAKDTACAGVMYFKSKKSPFLREMLKYYQSLDTFDPGQMYTYSIPKIISNILDTYSVKKNKDGIEIYNDHIWVYPKEYFYPVNYDWTRKFYTDKTVMIHHYDASWTGTTNKRNVAIRKTFSAPLANAIINNIGMLSRSKNKLLNQTMKSKLKIRSKISKHINVNKRTKYLKEQIKYNKLPHVMKYTDILVFSNSTWIGVSNVAKDIFGNFIDIREIDNLKDQEIAVMADLILSSNKKTIIFNGLVSGWEKIIELIKEKDNSIKIKVLYHGGDVRLARHYDYYSFMKIMTLHDKSLIDVIGFFKKEQAEFYYQKGVRCVFIANNIKLDPYRYKNNSRVDKLNNKETLVKIGLYCSGDFEWKNVFNQIAASSLVKNAQLDIIPINYMISGYAEKIKVNFRGSGLLPREDLLKRMAMNDINIHVSFAEAAPLMPLESLELGVPCITGNNHHYWSESELKDYLIVNRPDDVIAIYNQIEKVLKNKNKIIKLYDKWKSDYDKYTPKTIKEFIES